MVVAHPRIHRGEQVAGELQQRCRILVGDRRNALRGAEPVAAFAAGVEIIGRHLARGAERLAAQLGALS